MYIYETYGVKVEIPEKRDKAVWFLIGLLLTIPGVIGTCIWMTVRHRQRGYANDAFKWTVRGAVIALVVQAVLIHVIG